MLLLRGATCACPVVRCISEVSIHAPLARSNLSCSIVNLSVPSFNTCSSCEEQLGSIRGDTIAHKFQYMLLLRGATSARQGAADTRVFQYMLLLRGATFCGVMLKSKRRFNTCSSCEEQQLVLQYFFADSVSIHAPLARSNCRRLPCRPSNPVSIHAPLARSNCGHFAAPNWCKVFQYMLLLRGATRKVLRNCAN